MSASCCGEDWRVHATNLKTGAVLRTLSPTTMSWNWTRNNFGYGSLTLEGAPLSHVWPLQTGIFIERISGDDPRIEFGGYSETVDTDESGVVTVGLRAMDDYCNRRYLTGDLSFIKQSQTQILADLVNQIQDGVPLTAVGVPSTVRRTRNYKYTDFTSIGDMFNNMADNIAGPDWLVEHSFTDERKTTITSRIVFSDTLTAGNITVTNSVLESATLAVNGSETASKIFATGGADDDAEPDEDGNLPVVVATSQRPSLVQWDASPSWPDVVELPTLQEHADSELARTIYPAISLNATLVSRALIDGRRMRPGAVVNFDAYVGNAYRYQGQCLITGNAWKIDQSGIARLALDLVPYNNDNQVGGLRVSRDLPGTCKDC